MALQQSKAWRHYALGAGALAVIGGGGCLIYWMKNSKSQDSIQKKTENLASSNESFSTPNSQSIPSKDLSIDPKRIQQLDTLEVKRALVTEFFEILVDQMEEVYLQRLSSSLPADHSSGKLLNTGIEKSYKSMEEERLEQERELLALVKDSKSVDEFENLINESDKWMDKLLHPESLYTMSSDEIERELKSLESEDSGSLVPEQRRKEFQSVEKTQVVSLIAIGSGSTTALSPELVSWREQTPPSGPKKKDPLNNRPSPISVTYMR